VRFTGIDPKNRRTKSPGRTAQAAAKPAASKAPAAKDTAAPAKA